MRRKFYADAGMRHAMLVRRLLHGLHLQVIRKNDAGHLSLCERDPIGTVDQMRNLCGRHGGLDVGAGHIFE